MNTLLRILSVVALALALPACATPHKEAACCSTKGKCPTNDPSCHAPTAKKKAS